VALKNARKPAEKSAEKQRFERDAVAANYSSRIAINRKHCRLRIL
jgi:hypothetical protein